MDIAHDLFCSDSRNILAYLRWPEPIVGRRELSVLLCSTLFRGAGQEFRAEAVPGTVAQRYSVSFREPFLFDSPYSLKLDAYYFTRIYNEYTEDRLGGMITFGRRLGDNWTVSVGTRLEPKGANRTVLGARRPEL